MLTKLGILKRDFYILGPTQGSEGKGAIRQLKLFLSSKRIWLKIVQVFWTSDGCSILLCSSLFQKKYWWIVPVPEGNQSWICDFHNSEPVQSTVKSKIRERQDQGSRSEIMIRPVMTLSLRLLESSAVRRKPLRLQRTCTRNLRQIQLNKMTMILWING